MKRFLFLITVCIMFAGLADAQIIRAFSPRYYNPSVRGNIVYVSNSIISTSGIGTGVNEVPPGGLSKNNSAAGVYLDIDATPPTVKLPFNSIWNYHSNGAAPANDGGGNTWIQSAYTLTAAWNTGATGTGTGPYGFNSTQNTCIPNGSTLCLPGNGANKYSAYYFRNSTVSFTATELSTTYNSIQLNLKRNDGVVIYINGVERARDNMPAGVPSYGTFATAAIATGTAEDYTVNLSPSFFVAGTNTIAVEIHSDKAKSVDVNFDMQVLGVPLDVSGTFSSSAADLALSSSCNSILFAGLYWGADQGANGTDMSWMTAGFNTVKLKIPGSSTFTTVTSQQTDQHNSINSPGLPHTGYLCFADITSLLNINNANGTYTVGNVVGPVGITNACGGWTIVIVYSNPTLPPRNLTVFDGSVIINGGDPAVDVNINGFLTPPSGPVSCELGAVVYDGDRGSIDSFAFKQNGAPSFYTLSNTTVPLNGVNDAWNSKISHKGSVVTTRNPAYQNTIGYDASIIDLPNTSNAQLSNSQTGATVRFASPSENYFVHVLSTSISQYNPSFAMEKSSSDINGGLIIAGDSLRYTLNYQNVGNDISTNTVIIDDIPLGSTFLPGSLKINGIAKTDISADDQAEFSLVNNRVTFRVGTGANAVSGGTVAINGTGSVQFDVVLAKSCAVLSCTADSVRNTARIDYIGQTSLSALYDSSGVNVAGCITQIPVVNFVYGPCSTPTDTLIVNVCPATSVLLPWRRWAGYSIYSAQPFIPSNLFDPANPITTSHTYWAYYTNGSGCSHTVRISVYIVACPDIDDDNDGLPDYVEINNPLALQDANSNGTPNWNDPSYAGYTDNNSDGLNDNFDPSADSDNDGILNFYDANFPGYTDTNTDAVNDNMDRDLDGIPNHLDLDSDNDGIPDTVESYGVDANGDGLIDNYSSSDNDGFSQNVDASNTGVGGSGAGLGAQDLDNDGLPNYLDADSDSDGIPDVIEAGGTDANNDALIDNYLDLDGDGYSDPVDGDADNNAVAENSSSALLRTGPDANNDGRADSYPYKNMDNDGRANPYDLDSDGDGIADVIEAGFTDANYNGMADGANGTDGWNANINSLGSLSLRNTDSFGNYDYLDIDADDDGIPDNIEGMTTTGYQFPTYTDTDNDGMDNRYDAIVGFSASGIFVADKDGDNLPDYLDLDTDSDGIPDIVEGNDFNRNAIADDDVALTYIDTDGDGLDNKFDSLNSVINIKGTSYNMGTGGSNTGDATPGTRAPVQKTVASQSDRDWRYVGYVLKVQLLNFRGELKGKKGKLNWNITANQPLERFELERSTDNRVFSKVAEIGADFALNSTKSFEHYDDLNNVTTSIVYYRLKLVAANGQFMHSEIVALKLLAEQTEVTVSPNPATEFVHIRLFNERNTTATIRVIDYQGRTLITKQQNLNKGSNLITLDNLSQLSKSMYLIQILFDDKVINHKLLIRP